MMDDKQIIALLEKHKAGTLTDTEKAILESWYNDQAINSKHQLSDAELNQNLKLVGKRLPLNYRKPITKLWPRIAAAASILLCCSIGLYFYQHKTKPETIQVAKNDLAPGNNKAVLTLAGGQKIILNDAKNGTLARQGSATIQKTADGQVVYQVPSGNDNLSGEMQYNTITTPRGGQHQLTLSDGTKVWLNAASSLKYPNVFTGKERIVELTGEGYFEVTHHALQPFKVKFKDQVAEDIGTAFNINAYDDEPLIKTTLAEGSIALHKAGQTALLKPGQEALTSGNTSIIEVRPADLDAALSWRNGLFIFDSESLESIMRKVSRWYDVEVIYEGADPKKLFGGGVSRYKNASEVLRKLELTGGVHFTIEGRRIIARK